MKMVWSPAIPATGKPRTERRRKVSPPSASGPSRAAGARPRCGGAPGEQLGRQGLVVRDPMTMTEGSPEIIAINHDDYHAKHVGRTADGRQSFLTTPFEPAFGSRAGNEFVALYLFDQRGRLLEAKIDAFGPRATVDEERVRDLYERRLRELGDVTFERIEVAPFAIERFGTIFGLVLREPEEEGEPWAVEAQPGNYMAFFEPWDSGEYDT